MRWILPIMLLASCSQDAENEPGKSLYTGSGRDRLCIDGDRAGFIAYGDGDANCSARGRLDRTGERHLTLIPTGDADCRIELETEGDRIRLGALRPACSYYCGPGADYSSREFRESAQGSPAVDFAGDPLC